MFEADHWAVFAAAAAAFIVLDRRASRAQSGRLSRILQVSSPNLTSTVGLVLTGVSLAIEWGGGLYWYVPTVLVAVVGGVVSAWLFLVEEGLN